MWANDRYLNQNMKYREHTQSFLSFVAQQTILSVEIMIIAFEIL